ncbi:phage virion morphogenesis protein [Candidatus Magnetominusculus xianensis]|uniref:Phage virion morphogenesis protein n=1 Tax=Candidatus Magnetominusculus xianensis TaxID=1748249 RepID=A0ABR5SCG1_9BACT|nr:phage virion morphogenesis protein [Candidatus Magnetominusculus xianensis]KWT81149.1 phage virion morphogenesis protein [Candidatus Magnetominusculus xianensis]MBF0402979.1 phage virion morphogenesis protein [Nitrospirota bacterium]
MGVTITVGLEDKGLSGLISDLQAKIGDLTPVMKQIGELMVASVKKNFEVSGRPKWRPSMKLRKNPEDKTLILHGDLSTLFHRKAYNNRVEIGTNVKYAGVHQFGFSGVVTQSVNRHTRRMTDRSGRVRSVAVSAHSRQARINIPPRPFMMAQDEDFAAIEELLKRWLRK